MSEESWAPDLKIDKLKTQVSRLEAEGAQFRAYVASLINRIRELEIQRYVLETELKNTKEHCAKVCMGAPIEGARHWVSQESYDQLLQLLAATERDAFGKRETELIAELASCDQYAKGQYKAYNETIEGLKARVERMKNLLRQMYKGCTAETCDDSLAIEVKSALSEGGGLKYEDVVQKMLPEQGEGG